MRVASLDLSTATTFGTRTRGQGRWWYLD